MNIILTGSRGSGKTVIGRELASSLGLKFIDTDDEIERNTGKSIARIFETGGEARFRELEREQVLKVCRLDRHVIAVGGGAVENAELAAAMQETGVVILLTAPASVLYERIKLDKNTLSRRPSLTEKEGLAEVEELLERRKNAYHGTAHLKVETASLTPAEVAGVILDNIKNSRWGSNFSNIIT